MEKRYFKQVKNNMLNGLAYGYSDKYAEKLKNLGGFIEITKEEFDEKNSLELSVWYDYETEREAENTKQYHIYYNTPSGEKQRLTDDPVPADNAAEALEIWSDAIRDNSNGELYACGEEYAVEVK